MLTIELTSMTLVRVAPDELVVLDETAAEYFDDPEAALRPTGGDTPLGSGIDIAMVTPYVMAASGVVIPILTKIAEDTAQDLAEDLVKEPMLRHVRRLFKRHPDEAAGPEALTADQAAQVRRAVVAKCHAVGLPAEQAALVADATIGTLHIKG